MLQEVLKKVLEQRGLNWEEIMQELQAEQGILTYLKQVGQGAASLLPEGGWLTLDIIVEEEQITVAITGGTLATRTVQISRKSQTSGSGSGSREREGKGSRIVALLEEVCKKHGLSSLKEWERRSVAYHLPQIARRILRENQAVREDPDFVEAVRLWKEWHPERAHEAPEV